MGRLTLDRLVDRSRLDALIDAAGALAPGVTLGVVETPDASGDQPAGRPIVVDGVEIGRVVVARDADRAGAVVEVLAQAIELAAAEGFGRRGVTAAAIDDLRELALLSRLAETIGSAIDATGIASSVLATVSRPLGASAGLVLGPDDTTTIAAAGAEADIAALRDAAGPVIERLRAEDPTIGSCAEIGAVGDRPFASVLATFLRTGRGHHGTILLGRDPGAEPFSAADRQLIASVAGQAAIAIERVALQRQLGDRRAIDAELAIGRRIQISLMPRRFPTIEGWEFASAYEPAREVGGDFYDVFRLRDRRECVGLVVADVTGKGIPAAILMADARGLIHAAADHGTGPADSLGRVNRILVDERASGLFVTVAHGVLDANTGRLVIARAGHDPLHILRADGRLEILEPPGRLIGMVADLEIEPLATTLEPGDAFIGHTDGVTEARSTDGSFYGEERFRALLASVAGSSAGAIVDAVVTDVAAFRGRAEPSDDLTLLVVRREPDGAAAASAGAPGRRSS